MKTNTTTTQDSTPSFETNPINKPNTTRDLVMRLLRYFIRNMKTNTTTTQDSLSSFEASMDTIAAMDARMRDRREQLEATGPHWKACISEAKLNMYLTEKDDIKSRKYGLKITGHDGTVCYVLTGTVHVTPICKEN